MANNGHKFVCPICMDMSFGLCAPLMPCKKMAVSIYGVNGIIAMVDTLNQIALYRWFIHLGLTLAETRDWQAKILSLGKNLWYLLVVSIFIIGQTQEAAQWTASCSSWVNVHWHWTQLVLTFPMSHWCTVDIPSISCRFGGNYKIAHLIFTPIPPMKSCFQGNEHLQYVPLLTGRIRSHHTRRDFGGRGLSWLHVWQDGGKLLGKPHWPHVGVSAIDTDRDGHVWEEKLIL